MENIMLTLQKVFKYAGTSKDTQFSTLKLDFNFPVFSYSTESTYATSEGSSAVQRTTSSTASLELIQNIADGTYRVDLPVKAFVGENATAFAAYMQHIQQSLNPNLDDLSINIDVLFSDLETGIPVGGQTLAGLLLVKNLDLLANNQPQLSLTRADAANANANNAAGAAPTEYAVNTATGTISIAASSMYLLSRTGYDALQHEFATLTHNNDDTLFFSIIRQMMSFLDERTHTPAYLSDEVLARMGTLMEERKILNARQALEMLKKHFDKLFEFTLTVDAIHTLDVAGTLTLKTREADIIVTREDIELYDIAVEYATFPIDDEAGFISTHLDWSSNSNAIQNNSIGFAFTDSAAIIANAVHSLVHIVVKAHDGSVVWGHTYKKNDPILQKLNIECPLIRPNKLKEAEKKHLNSNKKLRGKLIAINSTVSLKDVTVMVRAKAASDTDWHIVAAAKTDAFGNFTLPYPFGQYVAAQAVVELTPDSPAAIPVHEDPENDECIADDFLYLMIKDIDAEPSVDHSDDDCGCETPKQVPRLPDQNDLINSNEYSQDIGGSCVNLSIPHRTLREFNYHAIVRTSDPDVANYTLKKLPNEVYELSGGGTKIKRAAVDLNNPVLWQDAPDAHANLNLYQAVTVATGHVLHYKSEFRADGYSMGDLLYSLPLAPGQKKQIVVFDASHTLRGAESQNITQGERLSAAITDEREIADQLGGGINEALSGSSNATTSGVSAGLGAAGSAGFFGASLGVAGGYANANSQASQNSARNVSQYFGEKLRQSIMQNANSYRQLNASVVTTVAEGQHYAAETEVVANHNHCHALTMMYFEVLRHFAIYQELVAVEECIFVPLLMTNFTPHNISKWRDVLARHLLPLHSNTYLQPRHRISIGRAHPLLKAFDANDRILTNYANVDFPTTTYDDEVISFVKGEITLRVNLPRPKTRYDRIKSLPIISQTVEHQEADAGSVAKAAALAAATGGLSLLFGDDGTKTVTEQVLARAKIFDAFMQLDANYQTVPPAKCMRVNSFRAFSINIFGNTISVSGADFFEDSILDRNAWKAYASILGYVDVIDMMEYYFQGRLIAEWDSIFYNDIIPVVYRRIIDQLHLDFIAGDWTALGVSYKGGERVMKVELFGTTNLKRKQFPLTIKLGTNNNAIKTIQDQVTAIVENVRIGYSTPHFNGVLFSGRINNDLLDDATLPIPESEDEKRNPKKEDAYLVQKLIEHLNSNIEHYNKALWFNLDADRRYMLLDGFNIQIFDDFGQAIGYRSLASVVKNQLLSIVGNSLVLPVAAGYKVSKSYIVEQSEDGIVEDVSLLDHYRPNEPTPPFRVSVPSRGVFLETVKSYCNACEPVEENTSQDWTKFTTDEPTPISPLVAPTPVVTNYTPTYKDFAPPMVNIQNAPSEPAPGAGLAGLNDLLGKSGIFNDITGLQGNQANAIKTLQSNNENVRALAESAKGLISQDRNTTNSDKIMGSLKKAKDSGAISQQDYGDLVKGHLQQVIDGGDSQKAQAESNKPSLTQAAVKAVDQGKNVTAQKVSPEGNVESVMIEGGTPENVLAEVRGWIPQLKQENDMACWATTATMLVNWQKQKIMSVPDVLAIAGDTYVQKFNAKQGLSASEKPTFLNALGMVGEPPASYPVKQYIDWVNTYGPLWITTDSSIATGQFSPHARILIKVTGTGSPDGVGTSFTFIDPASGKQATESFGTFLSAYEQMVTDNPADKLFIQIVHFGTKVNEGGVGGEGGPAEGGSADTDARRVLTELKNQIATYSGYAAGSTVKVVADYLKSKLENVWNGSGGIIALADYKEEANAVTYLDERIANDQFKSVATTAKTLLTETNAITAEWDARLADTNDPGTWAYTKSFNDGGQPYCVLRFYKLTKPGYAKDYFPIISHEICHYILFQSESLVEADTRDFLFDSNVAAADRAQGAVARNRFIQEVVGRRMNYLAHQEIDHAGVPDPSTPAQIGKMSCQWALTGTNGIDYYQPIYDFLMNKLPTTQARRNQIGIWMQNLWSKVTMFDNPTFAQKMYGDFNSAGEFLKTCNDAAYAAESENGIH
jgi:hypothetical protein